MFSAYVVLPAFPPPIHTPLTSKPLIHLINGRQQSQHNVTESSDFNRAKVNTNNESDSTPMKKKTKTHCCKHLSPDPAVFPWCKAAMGGAKLIIAKHVACHVTKHSLDSRKENKLSLLTGLGKGYCCILLIQIRPEGKVLCLKLRFAHTRRGLQMWFRPHFTESKFI